jgi:hypothetical protein
MQSNRSDFQMSISLYTVHSFALSVPFHVAKPNIELHIKHGAIGTTATNFDNLFSLCPYTLPKTNSAFHHSESDPKGTYKHQRGVFRRSDPYCSLLPPALQSDSLIGPDSNRDVRSARVRKENPLLTAEKPVCFLPTISCSTRVTIMSAFISAFDPPSDKGRNTSIWSTAFGGGQLDVKINAPLTLMSRVTPSHW